MAIIKLVSRTDIIMARLKAEGKVKYYPSTPEEYEAMARFSEEMEEVRRDSKIKQYHSEISAANCLLTA